MKFTQAILPFVFSAAAVAAPTATLDKRATTICGQWDSKVTVSKPLFYLAVFETAFSCLNFGRLNAVHSVPLNIGQF